MPGWINFLTKFFLLREQFFQLLCCFGTALELPLSLFLSRL